MSTLYDTDFYGWTQQQSQALRAAAKALPSTPESLDWENLADEIDSLGREQAAKLRSSLRLVLTDLLTWTQKPRLPTAGWRSSIGRERGQIRQYLQDNPSLTARLEELLPGAYEDARKGAADATGVPVRTFKPTSPFTVEQVLDEEFWPA